MKKHWLYDMIPAHRRELKPKDPKYWLWALFGNDDDGIFGEGPKSGLNWLWKWGDTPEIDASGEVISNEPGELSLKRFGAWQLRNPLHNLFFYVLGSADREEHTKKEILLLGNRYDNAVSPADFALLLHDEKPFLSFRVPWGAQKYLQVYAGWRERGNLGFAFRVKSF